MTCGFGSIRALGARAHRYPDAYLAQPWTMSDELQRQVGCVIGVDYPALIVEHPHARREALERYRETG